MDKPGFLQDKRTQQAVVMSLIVLVGEAATKVMERFSNFAAAHGSIPWRNLRGMRNRVAHGYFDIDLEVVWSTVHAALPALCIQLGALDDGSRGAAVAP